MQVRNSSILADKGKCFLSIYYWHQFSLFFIFVQAGIRCGNVTKRALFPASVNIQEVLAATHLYIWIHASTEAGNRVIGSAHLGVHRTVSQWMLFIYIYIYIYRHNYRDVYIYTKIWKTSLLNSSHYCYVVYVIYTKCLRPFASALCCKTILGTYVADIIVAWKAPTISSWTWRQRGHFRSENDNEFGGRPCHMPPMWLNCAHSTPGNR